MPDNATEKEIMKQAADTQNRDVTLATDGEALDNGAAFAKDDNAENDEPYFVERPE